MTPEQIKHAREAAGLSQAELARRIGVSAVAVHRWEKGTRAPSSQTLARIDEALRSAPPAGGDTAPGILILVNGDEIMAIGPRGPVSVEVHRIGEPGPPLSEPASRRLTRAASRHPQVGEFLAGAMAALSHRRAATPLE